MNRRYSATAWLLGLLLMGTFAVLVLLTLTFGASIYKNISGVMEEQNSHRTAMSYICAKVRAADTAGSVALGELDGTPALVLTEAGFDETYVTYIYCHDGWLTELFCAEDAALGVDSGERLLRLDSLELEEPEKGLLRAECFAGGTSSCRYIAVRSAGTETIW